MTFELVDSPLVDRPNNLGSCLKQYGEIERAKFNWTK